MSTFYDATDEQEARADALRGSFGDPFAYDARDLFLPEPIEARAWVAVRDERVRLHMMEGRTEAYLDALPVSELAKDVGRIIRRIYHDDGQTGHVVDEGTARREFVRVAATALAVVESLDRRAAADTASWPARWNLAAEEGKAESEPEQDWSVELRNGRRHTVRGREPVLGSGFIEIGRAWFAMEDVVVIEPLPEAKVVKKPSQMEQLTRERVERNLAPLRGASLSGHPFPGPARAGREL